jgi:hypothetical protein
VSSRWSNPFISRTRLWRHERDRIFCVVINGCRYNRGV